jgi:hypothetical protein
VVPAEFGDVGRIEVIGSTHELASFEIGCDLHAF